MRSNVVAAADVDNLQRIHSLGQRAPQVAARRIESAQVACAACWQPFAAEAPNFVHLAVQSQRRECVHAARQDYCQPARRVVLRALNLWHKAQRVQGQVAHVSALLKVAGRRGAAAVGGCADENSGVKGRARSACDAGLPRQLKRQLHVAALSGRALDQRGHVRNHRAAVIAVVLHHHGEASEERGDDGERCEVIARSEHSVQGGGAGGRKRAGGVVGQFACDERSYLAR